MLLQGTLSYFFRLSPAFEDEYVSIDIFNTNPAGERQSGVGPNPVHHGPQLSKERDHPKAERRGSGSHLKKQTNKQTKKQIYFKSYHVSTYA